MNIKEEMMKKAEILNAKLEGKEYYVKVVECFKNNGMKNAFVLIHHDKEEGHASATIYKECMEDVWDNDEKLIEYLDAVYEESKKVTVNIKEICSREQILATVKPRMISETNLENVINNEIVYARYLDMLILFYVEIPNLDTGKEVASYTIKRDNLKMAGVTKEELYINAIKNIEEDYVIENMEKVICRIVGITEDELEESMCSSFTSSIPMYVITNKQNVNGASVILNKTMLGELKEIIKGDYYILPSSVHECIVVPIDEADAESLREMVTEINDGQVKPEDRLTYNVYKYANGEIKIA